MAKALINYRHFPVAMGRYIHWALENLGHTVFSVGEYSGGYIPWGKQYYYPEYKMPPNLAIPATERYPLSSVLSAIEFKPDLIIQAGDVSFLEGKSPVPNIIIATDPHAVDYTPRLVHADRFVLMQETYRSKYPKADWMPYGYDADIHRWLRKYPVYDVVFCGLQYQHRIETLDRLKSLGYSVSYGLGLIYDDYVNKYNDGKIAFNWSSKDDLPARFWEGLAMHNLVVTNRVPDLKLFPDLKEDRDYVAFSTQDEAVSKIEYYLKNEDKAAKIAASGYKKVQPHTYTNRVKKLLKELGYA